MVRLHGRNHTVGDACDPETLERVLDCVLSRAETLLVIAHP